MKSRLCHVSFSFFLAGERRKALGCEEQPPNHRNRWPEEEEDHGDDNGWGRIGEGKRGKRLNDSSIFFSLPFLLFDFASFRKCADLEREGGGGEAKVLLVPPMDEFGKWKKEYRGSCERKRPFSSRFLQSCCILLPPLGFFILLWACEKTRGMLRDSREVT